MSEPARVGAEARGALADSANDVFVSAASIWETLIKVNTGRMTTEVRIDDAAASSGFVELPITWAHSRRSAELPLLHRDPFDRMLVGQAIEEGLVLVTRDPLVQQYPVPTMVG